VCVLFSTQMCVHACAYTSRGGGLDMETREPRRSSGIGCKQQAFERQWPNAIAHSSPAHAPWGILGMSCRLGTHKVARAAKRSDRMCTTCMAAWQEGWLPLGYHACTRSSDGMRTLHLLTAVG